MNNNLEYINNKGNEAKRNLFFSGVQSGKVKFYDESLMNDMKSFDYLGIPFITLATSNIFMKMYFSDIVLIMANLLTKYGDVKIVENNKGVTLILLTKADGTKKVIAPTNGLVIDYDFYFALEGGTLQEKASQEMLQKSFEKNNNITYISEENLQRIILIDTSLIGYRKGSGNTDIHFMTALDAYLRSNNQARILKKDNSALE